MIRTRFLAASALVLSLLAASSAQAQLSLRGLKFPSSLQNMALLRSGEVQKELGLGEEQKTELSDLGRQLQQEAFEILSSLQDLTPEEQKEAMPDLMEMIADKGKEVQEKVDNILDEKQRERLVELSLQSRNAEALGDDEVAEALKLTDEQKKKLAEVRDEGLKAMEEAMQGLRAGGGDLGKLREKMGDIRKELNDKALAVLDEAQQKLFDEMKGKKIDLPKGRGGLPF